MSQTTIIELSHLGYTSNPDFTPLTDISHNVSLSAVARSERHEVPAIIPLLDEGTQTLSNRRTITIIATLTGLNFLSSLSTGLLTIGLPQIAVEVGLPGYLLSWPSSVYTLTSGSCLLVAGSVADVVGNRNINLIGCFLVGCFILASGLARTGTELIMFRALQGIAVSLCLPTSVSIVAGITTSGRQRNIAFSCLGMVQPTGFSVGLVLGGVLLDTVGWRLGWFLCGGITFALFLISLWALPIDRISESAIFTRLGKEVDWVGAALSSGCLALLSYVLAALSSGLSNIIIPGNIAMLTIALLLIPAFIFWERRQEQKQLPALIPNSLWRNRVFTSICLMIIFTYAVANAMEFFCNLFFQTVQDLSALQASIRILPSLVIGTLVQFSTGLLIHKIPAFYLLMISLILSSGAPLLMATIKAQWPYWYNAFFAQLLSPICADILFTVGLLVVSDVFPARTQALAGAVFNTVAQFGTSIGLTLMAVISSSVTESSKIRDKKSPGALMLGYRASFWAAFAWMGLACFIGAFGLRKIGKVGLKSD